MRVRDLLQLVRVARRVPFFFLRVYSTAPLSMTLAIEALSLGAPSGISASTSRIHRLPMMFS